MYEQTTAALCRLDRHVLFSMYETPSSGLQLLVVLLEPKDIDMHLSGLRTHCRRRGLAHKLLLLLQPQQAETDQVHEGVIIQVPGQKLHDSFITISLQLSPSHQKKKKSYSKNSRRWFKPGVFYPMPVINVMDLLLILNDYLLTVNISF